jgi:hypothetical protein
VIALRFLTALLDNPSYPVGRTSSCRLFRSRTPLAISSSPSPSATREEAFVLFRHLFLVSYP